MLKLDAAWADAVAVVTAVEAGLGRWLLEAYGLGLTEYRAALLLSREGDRELRLAELAKRLGLNQSSVTRLVERMELRGLAFRDACPDDGRGFYAVVSDHGVQVAGEIERAYESKLRELLRDVSRKVRPRGQLGRSTLTIQQGESRPRRPAGLGAAFAAVGRAMG